MDVQVPHRTLDDTSSDDFLRIRMDNHQFSAISLVKAKNDVVVNNSPKSMCDSQPSVDTLIISSDGSSIRPDYISQSNYISQSPNVLNVKCLDGAVTSSILICNNKDFNNFHKDLSDYQPSEKDFDVESSCNCTASSCEDCIEDYALKPKSGNIVQLNRKYVLKDCKIVLSPIHLESFQKVFDKTIVRDSSQKKVDSTNSQPLSRNISALPVTKISGSSLTNRKGFARHKSIFKLSSDEKIFKDVFFDIINRVTNRQVVTRREILFRAHNNVEFAPVLLRLKETGPQILKKMDKSKYIVI